jgi:tetratricopeptide (TPR) repeat protein
MINYGYLEKIIIKIKMKKQILILLVAVIGTATAQKNKIKENTIDFDKIVYKNALKYNDASTAINSIHTIIAKEGENSVYKDSLAILYYKANNFASSYLVSEELLKVKPQDVTLLEINAISLQNLGDNKRAISAFEKLFAQTKNQLHGYQLAVLQMDLKRLSEASTSINQSLLCEELKDVQLQFSISKNQVQNVPFKAALYNLKGLIANELKDTETAKKSFEEALAIFPEFMLAKQNAAAITIESKKNNSPKE